MNLKSQSMNFVMETMQDVLKKWTHDTLDGQDTSAHINPAAPMVVQVGDCEVASLGVVESVS